MQPKEPIKRPLRARAASKLKQAFPSAARVLRGWTRPGNVGGAFLRQKVAQKLFRQTKRDFPEYKAPGADLASSLHLPLSELFPKELELGKTLGRKLQGRIAVKYALDAINCSDAKTRGEVQKLIWDALEKTEAWDDYDTKVNIINKALKQASAVLGGVRGKLFVRRFRQIISHELI